MAVHKHQHDRRRAEEKVPTVSDKPRFTWKESYQAIADALLARKNRRDEVRDVYVELTGKDDRVAIDPFTFFTAFNRGTVAVDRKDMVAKVLEAFGADAPVPQDFEGVPTCNHDMWQYFDNTRESADDCWALLEAALDVADTEQHDAITVRDFCRLFDAVHAQENITKARLTRTLYWMRPDFYLPFGERTRDYMHTRYGLSTPVVMKGAQYLRLLQEVQAVCDRPICEITARAYRAADESWWPSPEDFDPDVSIYQWMEILSDEELTSPEVMNALRRMIALGGDATTDELADERVHDRGYYGTLLRTYSRSVARHLGRNDYKGSWWPYIFVGQNAPEGRRGDYVWKLRPEVVDAIAELDKKNVA